MIAALLPCRLPRGLTLWGGAHFAPARTPDFLEQFQVDRAGIHVALFHGSEQGSFYTEEQGQTTARPVSSREIRGGWPPFRASRSLSYTSQLMTTPLGAGWARAPMFKGRTLSRTAFPSEIPARGLHV